MYPSGFAKGIMYKSALFSNSTVSLLFVKYSLSNYNNNAEKVWKVQILCELFCGIRNCKNLIKGVTDEERWDANYKLWVIISVLWSLNALLDTYMYYFNFFQMWNLGPRTPVYMCQLHLRHFITRRGIFVSVAEATLAKSLIR